MTWFSRAPDRRHSPRYKAEVPVVISVVADQEIASMRSQAHGISEGGLSVSGLRDMAVGQAVSLEIRLPIATQAIWTEAVVRHNGGHCGLQLVSLSVEQRQLIKRYCRLQPREKRRF